MSRFRPDKAFWDCLDPRMHKANDIPRFVFDGMEWSPQLAWFGLLGALDHEALKRWIPFFTGITYRTYIVCFVLSLATAWSLTPWVGRLAIRIGAVDRPRLRKVHTRTMPRLGGLAIFIGMWLPLALLFLYTNAISLTVQKNALQLYLIGGAGLSMLVLGAFDDKYDLRPRHKLLGQFTIAIVLVCLGVRFQIMELPWGAVFNFGWLSMIVSVLWIVGVINAINLIDGIDGLATGVAFFLAVTNGIIALIHGHVLWAVVMCSMAGACLGFLRYNFNPATIFLGDSGSLFLGATLVVSSVLCNTKASMVTSLLIPTLLVGYPIIDTLLAILRRLLRGKPIFSADAGHIHHRLLAKGLDHGAAALVIYAVCIMFCLAALAMTLQNSAGMAVGVVLIGGLLAAGLWYLGYLDYFTTSKLFVERQNYQNAYLSARKARNKIAGALTREAIVAHLCEASLAFEISHLKITMPARNGWPPLNINMSLNGCSDPVSGDGQSIATMKPVEDHYRFPDTGLHIAIEFHPSELDNELLTERRTLISDLAKNINTRIARLMPELPPASAKTS